MPDDEKRPWNPSPNDPGAWCPRCKGPMTERGCFKGDACKDDDGRYHALEIGLAPGGPR